MLQHAGIISTANFLNFFYKEQHVKGYVTSGAKIIK